jgi:hypothetical protein
MGYFDWIGERLKVKKLDDWYDVKIADLHKHNVYRILDKYFEGIIDGCV